MCAQSQNGANLLNRFGLLDPLFNFSHLTTEQQAALSVAIPIANRCGTGALPPYLPWPPCLFYQPCLPSRHPRSALPLTPCQHQDRPAQVCCLTP